jgi:hypothetical protein
MDDQSFVSWYLSGNFSKLTFETPFFLLPLPSSKIVMRDSSKRKRRHFKRHYLPLSREVTKKNKIEDQRLCLCGNFSKLTFETPSFFVASPLFQNSYKRLVQREKEGTSKDIICH